jgi:hypothetical protein
MNRRHRYQIYLTLLLSALSMILAGCGNAPAPTDTAAAAPPSTSTPMPADTMAPAPTDTTAPSPTHTGVAPIDTPTPGDSGGAGNAVGMGNADVLFVEAVQAAGGTWTFSVTVEHPDTGWEDYADGWDVVTPDGQVLKPNPGDAFTRVLFHPHENEQPFTRSQSGIAIPEGVTEVRVRAHDLVDGYGGQEVLVDLTVDSGPDFEVKRQ